MLRSTQRVEDEEESLDGSARAQSKAALMAAAELSRKAQPRSAAQRKGAQHEATPAPEPCVAAELGQQEQGNSGRAAIGWRHAWIHRVAPGR